jgi:hypothetical protein
MDNLKKLNSLTLEELKELQKDNRKLTIVNKKTNQKGKSTFKNLLILEKYGLRKNYEIIAISKSNEVVKPIEVVTEIEVLEPEFIAPEIPLFDNENKIKKTRKPKNN